MEFAKPQITFPNRNRQFVLTEWLADIPTAISVPLTYHMNYDYAISEYGRYHSILTSLREYHTCRPPPPPLLHKQRQF